MVAAVAEHGITARAKAFRGLDKIRYPMERVESELLKCSATTTVDQKKIDH